MVGKNISVERRKPPKADQVLSYSETQVVNSFE